VSEELKDDISELLGIVDNTDKNKDFLITKAEWDDAHAKSSPEDELIDREYVLLAKGVFDYQLLDRPPGLVNPDNYPELIASREKMKKEIEARDAKLQTLAQEKRDAEDRGDLFMASTIGLGGTLLVSALSLVFLHRRRLRKPVHPEAQAAIRQQQIGDDGIPPARQRVVEPTVVVIPSQPAATPEGNDENDEIEAELNRLTRSRTEP
jgi:hypothetical protein